MAHDGALTGDSRSDRPSNTPVSADPPGWDVVAMLDDQACRAILRATDRAPKSAADIEEECDLPQSTVYRKLDRLTEAGLLAERVRIAPACKHHTEYVRRFGRLTVSFEAGEGFELAVSLEDPTVTAGPTDPDATADRTDRVGGVEDG